MADLLSLINEVYPDNRKDGAPLLRVHVRGLEQPVYGKVKRCDPRGLVLENGEGRVIIPLDAIAAITENDSALTHRSAATAVEDFEATTEALKKLT